MKPPPKYPLRFFRWFCHPHYVEDIEGDLTERFENRVGEIGLRRARLLFLKDVITLFRPSLMRPITIFHPLTNYFMFRNNLKLAWRNLFKNKFFSLINIGGLAAGILVLMLIGLWVYDEISYNQHFEQSDRIALIMQNQSFNGQIETWNNQAMQLEPVLREQHGDFFKYIATTTNGRSRLLGVGNEKATKSGIHVGPDFVEMLDLQMVAGDRTALEDPKTVLLSATTAEAFFGKDNPVGKSITMNHDIPLTVGGVYEDLPDNSSFSYVEYLAPFELEVQTANLKERVGWGNSWFKVYVEIADHTTMEQVSAQIAKVKYDNIEPESAQSLQPELFLHPMPRWHLYERFENGVNIGGRIESVRMFGIIALFVLLLACINFMNLSTARSEKRAREVGIRKTLGSVRLQLIGQFFSEALLVTVLGFGLAVILTLLLLPQFNEVAGKEISMPWTSPWFWLAGFGFTLLTTFVAGSYPSFYLSAFKPVKTLKGTFRTGRFAALPRKALVVLQFTVSISLIIGTLFIFRQIDHAKDRPIGYNRDNLIRVPIKSDEIITHFQALRSDLLNSGYVEEMAGTDSPVTSTGVTNGGFTWDGMDPTLSNDFTTLRVTYEFGDMVDWEIIAGRDFSRDFGTDSTGFILNEAAVEYMGLENPVGMVMERGDSRHPIVGVVKNLITQSPYQPVRQTIFMLHETWLNQINIKLKPESRPREALAAIETIFKKYDPLNPFEHQFADEEYARKFQDEERVGKLATFFAILAVFISCLGLFGLASYIAEQRTKEIGIRKVLGASVATLWQLLSRDFIMLIVIACLLAAPIAYLLVNHWLADFSYRINLSWWVFAVVGVVAIGITMLTVSFQALRAALMNPVHAIKSE